MLRRILLFGLGLLTACRQQAMLPELPAVPVEGMQPAVSQAIEAALTAARRQPGDAASVAQLGMVLQAHQQLAAASRAYERATALEPTNPDYAYYWGTALAADGRYAEAVTPLRKAIQLHGRWPARLLLADSLYALGKKEEARRDYEALVTQDPTAAAGHYGLGRCLEGAAAAKSLEQALALFPRYGAAQFALAAVYRQMGERAKADAALATYERDKLVAPPLDDPAMAAVQALDVSAMGMLRAARAADAQGQLPQAVALQERALAADPKLTLAWVNLISLQARLGQPEKAEAAYRQAIALEPGNVEAHYNYGIFRAQAGDLAGAQKAFERTVALDPNHADALDSLGAVVEQFGAWDRAAALYRRALAAQPNLRLAHYHLGRILANQRKYPAAIREFEQSILPLDDQSPGFLYALGATHARAGDYARAIEILQQARAEAGRWPREAGMARAIDQDLEKLRNRR